MKHLKLFFALFAMLALGVGNAWAETVTLSNANIAAKYNSSQTSYRSITGITDDNGHSYSAYAILNQHSKATSTNKFLQIKKYASNTAYYVQVPQMPGNITSISMTVSSSSQPMTGGGNSSTLYFSNSNKTSATGTGVASGTGAKSVTIDCSSLKLKEGFITAGGAVRIWDITITYETSSSEEPALSSIEISGNLTNKTYEEGEELNFAGLTVTAKYDDNSEEDVTEDVEWSYTPNPLTKGTTSVEVTATYEDKTATTTITGLIVNEHIVTPDKYCIVPNNAFWGTSYNGTDANAATTLSGKQNDITILHARNTSGSLYVNDTQTRAYAGHTMKISVPSGYVITSIEFTTGTSWEGNLSADCGTMVDNFNWKGTNQNVTITFNDGKCFITNICVTYIKDVKYALTITEPTEGGTLVVKDGENVLTSGAEIYEGTKLTVTATPETGYEEGVVVVKNASEEEVTDDVYDAGTLTMPAYAVTISATFAKKPCTLLTTPVVTATPTYNSATLTWAAVANAAKYSVTVGETTTEVTEPTYTATGLNAETTYTYQVQAIAEAEQDMYCDSEVAEGPFTTTAAPVATLTLSDIEGTTTQTGALNGTITLPTTAAECSKTFVGWDADENCDHAPTYAPGAEYTLAAETQTLYAVYADGEGGGTVTITPSKGTEETKACTFNLDQDGYTLSASGGGSNPVYNETNSDARIYAGGILTLTATKAMNTIVIKLSAQGKKRLAPITVSTGTIATQAVGDATVTWTGNATEVAFTVGDKANFGSDGETKAGQLCFSTIEVTHSSEYSNYSTTCAAAPIATVDPTSVTATAAGAEGKVTVTYENVNTENVAVALFNDAACTEAFTAGWLTASLDGDKNITYTVAATTLYTERKAYIQLTAPETTGATDPDVVVIPVTQAAKEKVFASLAELVAADLTEGDEVTVTLNNDVIKEFYIYSSKRCGVVFDVQKDGKDIKIYFNNQTTIDDWAVGGKLSGTLTNVKWTTYSSAWQLAPANTWAWANLTYTEPKAVSTVVVSGAPTKTTYVDGEAFDPAGLTVTVNYNDATTEVNPTGVTFTVTPATLVKGQTSVSVTATYNSVTSAPYEVTGLTVNDIPTKTVAEFIAAGGTRCYLEGIVSGLTEGNSMKYGNFDLTDASGKIYVYGCLNAAGESQKFADLGVKNGDKIKVIADDYELYGGTKDEAKNVQYVSHVSNSEEPEAPELPTTAGNATFVFNTAEGLADLGIAYPTTEDGTSKKTDIENNTTVISNGVGLTMTGGNTTATRIWLTASEALDLRVYKGATLTFAVADGYEITKVVFDGSNLAKLSVGGVAINGNTKTWEGSKKSVVFDVTDGVKINTIAVTVAYTRSVTSGKYGTICLPYASSSYSGAEFYEVSWLKEGVGLYLDQLTAGAQLEAGKPYIFKATDSEITVTYTGEAKATPVAGANGLTGTFTDIAAGGVLVDNYIIAQNQIWVAGASNTLPANRAYINKNDVPTTEQAKLPGRRRVCMGENAETGVDNIITTDAPVKVIENGQLIIIRDGVKYNVQGQKL